MREDLLGYLLGALEPHEMERVAALLRESPAARAELDQIQCSLRPLEDGIEQGHALSSDLPSGLVDRTLDELPPLPDPNHASSTDSRHGELPTMRCDAERQRTRSLTWLDLAAIAGAAAVMLALLVPSIAEGRFQSRRTACQDQLRNLGVAITAFVDRSEQERLPAVAKSGPEAFAGVFAIRLKDAGLLDDDAMRWCPSLDAPGDQEQRFEELNNLPSIKQLHEAPIDQLRSFQQHAGGHYAYTLGVVDNDHFESPRFESRASFAVLADASLAGMPSESNYRETIGHDGRGINVLFEDGRVQFINVRTLGIIPDHPLFNHHGQVEAGVNVDDASLAPSWRPPFVNVPQR